jgi:hypothetical protein
VTSASRIDPSLPADKLVDSFGRAISESNEALDRAVAEAIARKPKGHDFVIERSGAISALARHMSMTGG